MISKRIVAAFAIAVMLVPSTASAQSLLGGLLGGGDSGSGGGLLGGSGGGVVSVSDNAGTSSAVNLGVGGSDGLVTLNLGSGGSGSTAGPLVNASVLGPRGIADVNANLGDVGANVNLGGPGLVGVDVRLPRGSNGNNGNNGNNGGNGANGGNGNNGFFSRSGSSGAVGLANGGAACAGTNANQLISVFQASQLSGWNRASNIQLIPVQVCRDLRRQVANWLAANPNYHNMVGQVASDALIAAALSRTNYQPGHVLGVQRQGATLMVYVF